MNTGIYAIVQARMSSQRFPNKALADILGKPMLQRVLERLQASELLEKVILATTTNPEDKVLIDLASSIDIPSFAGSEDDVLDRLYQAANGANTVVRITGDCPLVDPKLIEGVLQYHFLYEYEFTTDRPSYPDGLDIEVMSYPALQRAWESASSPYDREHVTSYILSHPEKFRIGRFSYDIPLPDSFPKLSVDAPQDLELVRKVYSLIGEYCTTADIIDCITSGYLS